jgi:hypothetical protein
LITWSIPEPVTEVPENKHKPLPEDCLKQTESVVFWYKGNTIPATDMIRGSIYTEKEKQER